LSRVGEPRPIILHTGNNFTEALALSCGTQVLVLFVMLFMPFSLAVYEYFPYLFFLWILSAAAALYHVSPRKPETEPVMVRPGYPIDRKIRWSYYLLIASAVGDLFAVVVIEIGISSNYAQFPALHLLSVVFIVIAVMALLKSREFHLEIRDAQKVWKIAVQHSTLKAASTGNVVLGHQFEHLIQSRPDIPSASPQTLPGEVVAKTTLQLIGPRSDGAYILDLAEEINPHVVVLGASGIGKTQSVKSVVLRYWLAKKIPSLIIDWTSDYAKFIRDVGGVVWTVPANFTINPLKLLGSSPDGRTEDVEEALFHSIGLTPLQTVEVGKTILEAYERVGIVEGDPSTWSRPPPTIAEIVDMLRTRAEAGYYRGEDLNSITWTIRKFHSVRRIFGVEETDFFDTVLRIPTCIDLSSLNDAAKAQVSYTVLQRIRNQCEKLGFSDLRLLIVLDEAQLILTEKQTTGIRGIPEKPLPVRLVETTRKHGLGIVISTHLASTVPKEIRVNAATVILLTLEEPDELRYIRKWLNVSKPELETYAELPLGGCFVKHSRERYPALVRVQMPSEKEFEAAKIDSDSASVGIPKTKPSGSPPILTVGTLSPKPMMTAEEKLLQFLSASEKTVSLPEETPAVSSPVPPPVLPLESELPRELTPDETRVLNALTSGPVTMKDFSDKVFPKIEYRKMLDILNDLDELDLIQVERVANLEGKSTIYYAALREEWVQSEGIEHRSMLDMIEKAFANLHPARYGPTNPNNPDLGLENSIPRTCVEVETGRKKLPPEELDEWARNVNERDRRLGYERTVVVVPSVAVERRYADACKRHNLELTTMANLLAHFGLKRR